MIIVLAYFVFAKNVYFNPFIHGSKKIEPVSNLNKDLSYDEFLERLPIINNTIRIGGGSVIIYFDTIQQKVLLQTYFLNKENTLQLDKDHFQSIINRNIKSKVIIDFPFPFEPVDGATKKYADFRFDRGFYLGIYRELLENISLWEEKYGNLVLSFGTLTDPDSKQEMIIVNIKTRQNGELNDVVYILPNIKTDQHLYDFMITDTSVIKEAYQDLLNSFGHTRHSTDSLQKAWKIHPKKYELRKLKWNYD